MTTKISCNAGKLGASRRVKSKRKFVGICTLSTEQYIKVYFAKNNGFRKVTYLLNNKEVSA